VPAGAVRDRQDYLQVAEELGGLRTGFCVLRPLAFTMNFQKQCRLVENPLPDQSGSVTPGGVQFTRFTGAQLEPGKDRGHALARLYADACHRHQELHRDLGADFSPAHAFLNRVGQ
jgi:hypothetical protein